MSITLSDGTNTIELPPEMNWSDRIWSPVAQSFTRGLTGKPIIMSDASQFGRPITLEPPGWMLATLEPQIITWHNTLEQKLTLNFHGETHTVQFRHHDGPGYESTPVRYVIAPGPDHKVIPTFRFITVEP
ncbi:hypothetical protein GCM10011533_30420 [Streptosporangium jomthongense]|uniref:Uncharacterized protein n=1 Tax=Marinobacter aromaticivorans TaxID=1494078 RepID=A0ABW2IZ92_9GAMM|nr:hypothetical protein [Marinobacter aromaticivorans]GGE75959.1 hypothetical protein GCM10011533_30420 [Streptosporangium jomthongense]